MGDGFWPFKNFWLNIPWIMLDFSQLFGRKRAKYGLMWLLGTIWKHLSNVLLELIYLAIGSAAPGDTFVLDCRPARWHYHLWSSVGLKVRHILNDYISYNAAYRPIVIIGSHMLPWHVTVNGIVRSKENHRHLELLPCWGSTEVTWYCCLW